MEMTERLERIQAEKLDFPLPKKKPSVPRVGSLRKELTAHQQALRLFGERLEDVITREAVKLLGFDDVEAKVEEVLYRFLTREVRRRRIRPTLREAAAEFGARGGRKRAQVLSAQRRREIAKIASAAAAAARRS